ncbi:MAG: methylated-DNA--[protein]-cysteine S-methyltransferase [Cyanobacteria bacterium J06632_22]
MIQLRTDRLDSPIGDIFVVVDETTLCAVDFAGYEDRMMTLLHRRYGEVELVEDRNPLGVTERLAAYLQGELASLDDLPVSTGGTPFQQQVWQQLRAIAPGTVWTYGELAQRLNHPKAVRAVGMANSLNPVSIVLPCHRVVGANRKLTGYAGGLDRKRWLLAHEGVPLINDKVALKSQSQPSTPQDQLSMFSLSGDPEGVN